MQDRSKNTKVSLAIGALILVILSLQEEWLLAGVALVGLIVILFRSTFRSGVERRAGENLSRDARAKLAPVKREIARLEQVGRVAPQTGPLAILISQTLTQAQNLLNSAAGMLTHWDILRRLAPTLGEDESAVQTSASDVAKQMRAIESRIEEMTLALAHAVDDIAAATATSAIRASGGGTGSDMEGALAEEEGLRTRLRDLAALASTAREMRQIFHD